MRIRIQANGRKLWWPVPSPTATTVNGVLADFITRSGVLPRPSSSASVEEAKTKVEEKVGAMYEVLLEGCTVLGTMGVAEVLKDGELVE